MQTKAAIHGAHSKLSSLAFRIRKHKLHLLMILPVIVWYIIFKYMPMYGITLAFKDYKILQGITGSEWIGFSHFNTLFTGDHGLFFASFKNTLILAFANFVFGFPAPIVLALLLNELRSDKFKRVAQTFSYLPHFISWIILSGIFFQLLHKNTGPVNYLISLLGGERISFLGDERYFRGTMVVTNIWKGVGWGSIVYLAALTGVSEELYDAARVDGCGRWKRIWHVTLPAIVPTITIMMILAVGNVVSDNFDQVFNMNSAVTSDVGEVLGTYIYKKGIFGSSADPSYGTAADLFRNIISLALVVSANYVSKRVNEYGLW